MHFKCLNNCNWPTRSSPEPKASNMGSFSLIKSSTDTLCRKPHRMERIISRSSAGRAAALSSPSRWPALPNPLVTGAARTGLGTAGWHLHPRPCVPGGPRSSSLLGAMVTLPFPVPTPPGTPGCPPAREAPRSPGSHRVAGEEPGGAIQVAG